MVWRICCAAALCLMSVTSAQAEKPTKKVGPQPVSVLAGKAQGWTGMGFKPRLALYERIFEMSALSIDAQGTQLSRRPTVNNLFRVGLRYTSRRGLKPVALTLEYEHDLWSGVIVGGSDGDLGVFMPDAAPLVEQTLRKAYLRVTASKWLTMAAGFMTSHWGLGLIANDGAHTHRPGSARFTDPRGGDRVLRFMIASGPHSRLGLRVFAAADKVMGDDVLIEGDTAYQIVGGFLVGKAPYQLGMYGVYRTSRSAAGRDTRVGVVDIFGSFEVSLNAKLSLRLSTEVAVILGRTALAPSADFPEHDVFQLGAVIRAELKGERFGAVLDIVYASGDRDFDDQGQNAFRADRNFTLGLLLFRHVLAAQTGRSPVSASDPELVGYPADDLDRFPTRGSVTNTLAFFPRFWFRAADGLELYGGPLIALAAVDYSDPLHTRLAGGANRNPLGGTPGAFYGVEIDLGIRYHTLIHGTRLMLGLEAAIFMPGSAFTGADGTTMDLVYGGRGLFSYEF